MPHPHMKPAQGIPLKDLPKWKEKMLKKEQSNGNR